MNPIVALAVVGIATMNQVKQWVVRAAASEGRSPFDGTSGLARFHRQVFVAGQPARAIVPKDNGFALAEMAFFIAEADVGVDVVHENRHITLDADVRVARLATEHRKAVCLPARPHIAVSGA